jgi:hypothetical protein
MERLGLWVEWQSILIPAKLGDHKLALALLVLLLVVGCCGMATWAVRDEGVDPTTPLTPTPTSTLVPTGTLTPTPTPTLIPPTSTLAPTFAP